MGQLDSYSFCCKKMRKGKWNEESLYRYFIQMQVLNVKGTVLRNTMVRS